MSDPHTKYCVRCGAPAKSWSGHVLNKREKKIVAGWCAAHMIGDGFVGHYRKWMGKWSDEYDEKEVTS